MTESTAGLPELQAMGLVLFFVLGGVALLGTLLLDGRPQRWLFTLLGLLQSLLLLAIGAGVLFSGHSLSFSLWNFYGLDQLQLQLTPFNAIFMVITAGVFAASLGFAAHDSVRYQVRSRRYLFLLLYESLYLSMAVVFIANDVLSFVLSWELMSLLIYALVLFDHESPSHSRAGYLTLALSELGSVAGIIGLLLLSGFTGHMDFAGMHSAMGALGDAARWIIFLLTFFGFGVKAGLVPVNLWLPDAHASAPRSVSPVLSGATLNLGVYAIMLVNTLLLPVNQNGPGIVALIIGSVSAIIGILYAVTQRDMKRTLAHSSIENLGIVIAAWGAALLFAVQGLAVLAGMALIVSLYHMLNHSSYKTLLFIGAGAVDAATGTHNMNRLGGLIRLMPWTTLCVLAGVMAICALPPFNGFVSEWLTLQVLLRAAELASVPVKITFAIAGALLALTAALALTCFIMVFAMSFLGVARSPAAVKARKAPWCARLPMAVLALVCLALGVLPTYVIPALDRVTAPLVQAHATDALVPAFFGANAQDTHGMSAGFVHDFHNLGAQLGQSALPGRGVVVLHQGGASNPVVFAMSTSYTLVMLLLILFVVWLVFRWLTRRQTRQRGAVWAGGIRYFTPRTAYSVTGFAAPVRVLFNAILRPVTLEDATETTGGGYFRTAIRREHAEFHIVDRLTLRPVIRLTLGLAGLVRRMHHGRVNAYAAYVLISLLLVLIIGLWWT